MRADAHTARLSSIPHFPGPRDDSHTVAPIRCATDEFALSLIVRRAIVNLTIIYETELFDEIVR
jgi:hypothetical protein